MERILQKIFGIVGDRLRLKIHTKIIERICGYGNNKDAPKGEREMSTNGEVSSAAKGRCKRLGGIPLWRSPRFHGEETT